MMQRQQQQQQPPQQRQRQRQRQRRRRRRPLLPSSGGTVMGPVLLPLLALLVLLLLARPVRARKAPQPPAPYKAHFSDFYQVMTPEDYHAYSERLREIIDWGLRNTRRHEPNKGPLQSFAEDWPLVPGPVRRGIRSSQNNFVEVTARRQKVLDDRLNQTRARIERGLQKKGFLVAYYMFNHDCNAMGAGEEHPSWVFRLPKVRLGFPHSRRHVSRYLVALRNRKFNHMYVGVTQEFEPYGDRVVEDWLRMKGYEGFKVKTRRVLLGKGPEIYAKAKKKMVNWELNDAVPWVNFLEGEHGINVVSRIRCYGLLWTLNPLRKVLCHEKPWGKHGSVAAVAVSTLQGHLLEGEERFSVCYEGGRNGQVWFNMLSFSKGSFPLGRLLTPLIRPLQHRFFVDLGNAMQKAVLE